MLAALARPSGQTLSRGDAPRTQAESSAVPPATKNSATTAVADDTRQTASARIGGHNLNHTKDKATQISDFDTYYNRMISTLWIHSESGEARSFQAYAYMHFWRPTLQVWTRASSCIPSASCNVEFGEAKLARKHILAASSCVQDFPDYVPLACFQS